MYPILSRPYQAFNRLSDRTFPARPYRCSRGSLAIKIVSGLSSTGGISDIFIDNPAFELAIDIVSRPSLTCGLTDILVDTPSAAFPAVDIFSRLGGCFSDVLVDWLPSLLEEDNVTVTIGGLIRWGSEWQRGGETGKECHNGDDLGGTHFQ